MNTLTLLQFPYSHFNEKARWALDWKTLPHRRENYLPGPHAPQIRRLTGETTVPVLKIDSEVIGGSARIIDALETRFPDPALYPADNEQRERALEIQSRFDDVTGPMVRRALFAQLLEEPDYLCNMFSPGRSALMRGFYRRTFPLVRGMMAKSMGVTGEESIREATEATREALDFVAKESAETGYLVGDRFSVADLSAAALLAPLSDPPHPDMQRPRPMPARLEAFLADWSRHPGVEWVHEMYRRHRPASAATSTTP